MGSPSRIRIRRNAAQLHALVQIEREIRAADALSRRKYLRDFNEAYQSYQRVLRPAEVESILASADVVLVGDYHALPRSQAFVAELVEHRVKSSSRPVILGIESIFSRDQHILDEWQRGEIGEQELRERLRYDLEWGYDWQPFYDVLCRASRAGVRICAMDGMPRGDLRRIANRDRHAATKIAEVHGEHPEAQIIVLFGESHLAPNHLPELVKAAMPLYQVVTVLQNIDALYWQATGEPGPTPAAVSVSSDVICVFNATPLEKYQSYRLCIEQWRQERRADVDFAPSFFSLVDALASFFNIEQVALSRGAQATFLYDLVPEVMFRSSTEQCRALLQRKGVPEPAIRDAMYRLDRNGAAWVQHRNVILVQRFDLAGAAEEIGRFVHAVCRGAVGNVSGQPDGEQAFYSQCLQSAIAHLGSLILYPARDRYSEQDLYSLYSLDGADHPASQPLAYPEFMRVVDFLVLHKDYECNARKYRSVPQLIAEGRNYTGEQLRLATEWLGRMLGTQIYDAFVSGRVHKRTLRSLLFRRFDYNDEAKTLYFQLARRTRLKNARWVT